MSTPIVHEATSSSTTRCGAPVSPYWKDGRWHWDGVRIDGLARVGGHKAITCPDCNGKDTR